MVVISPEIHLPLQASVWAAELSDHPDNVDVSTSYKELAMGSELVLTEDNTLAQLGVIST